MTTPQSQCFHPQHNRCQICLNLEPLCWGNPSNSINSEHAVRAWQKQWKFCFCNSCLICDIMIFKTQVVFLQPSPLPVPHDYYLLSLHWHKSTKCVRGSNALPSRVICNNDSIYTCKPGAHVIYTQFNQVHLLVSRLAVIINSTNACLYGWMKTSKYIYSSTTPLHFQDCTICFTTLTWV